MNETKYLNQLNKGDSVFCIDVNNIDKGICSTQILLAEHIHNEDAKYVYDSCVPIDTWRFAIILEAHTIFIKFDNSKLTSKYVPFNMFANDHLTNHNYLIATSKEILIERLKADTENELLHVQSRKQNLENDLANVTYNYNRLLQAKQIIDTLS